MSGHVPAFLTAEQFVNADEFQQANFLFPDFLFDDRRVSPVVETDSVYEPAALSQNIGVRP